MRTKFGQNGWRASGDHQRTVSFHPWLARVVSLVALLLTLLATASPVAAAPKRALSGSHLQISPAVVNETLNPNDPPISTYSVTLTNSGAGSSTWAISSTLPSWLSVSPTSDTLASGSSENLTLTFTAPSTIPQTYSTNLMLSDPGADDSPLTLPVNLSVGYYSRTWYFAEGYTGGSFTEYLTLANPNPDNATVTVQYLLDDGSPLTQTYSVLSNSRYTINVNHVVGPGFGVALAITSDLPIMAERPMYFTYTGMSGISVPGGTDTLGATSLGTTFAFAYLDTTAKHHTYLTVLNQNSVAIQALVKYYPANGGVASNRLYPIPARSRGTILVNSAGLGAGTFSAVVSLSATSPNTQVPALGLVERPMYFVDSVTGYTGSTDVIGMPYGSQSWDFAEGYTSSTFNERYILANPFSTSASRATVTFYRSDGTSAQQLVTLQPGQQVMVSANAVLGIGFNNSAHVSADQPILAERYMSFTYTGSGTPIPGGTDVLGAQQTSNLYYFAEGYSGGGFAEYLTVENPNPASVTLTVTFLPANGSDPTIKTYNIGATSRYTLLTNSVMPNQSFSMMVQSSRPVVAERPMYFNYNNSGQTGGTDVIGYAPQVYPYANQGYCSCAYVTNGTLMAGGLDETTGLLEFTYPYDRPLSSTPLLAGGMVYSIIYGNTGYGSPAAARGGVGGGSASTSQLVAMNSPAYPQWALTPGPSQGFDNSPVSDGANVYIGIDDYSSPDSTAHYMDALDNWSGMVTWSTPIDSYIESQPVEQNGALYFTTGSSLYALSDANGQILWQDALPTTSYCYGPAIAGMSNGVIYTRTCSDDYSGGATDEIEGIDSATGATVWSDTIQTGGSSLVLKSDQSSLYADDGYGNVYAFDPTTGAQQWVSQNYNYSITAVGDGLVITEAYDFDTNTSSIAALDATTGSMQWQFPLQGGNYLTTNEILTDNSGPAGPALYFGLGQYNTSTSVYSLNLNSGAVNWEFQTAEIPDFSPYGLPPFLAVGYSGVYFYTAQASSADFIYKIDASRGTQVWRTELDLPPNQNYLTGGFALDDQLSTPQIVRPHQRPSDKPQTHGKR